MNKEVNTQTIGRNGEKLAEIYLLDQGMHTLMRNFTSRYGEIDLVMKDKNTIVFVEVRLRKSNHFGTALETVTAAKQRKLRLSAQYYNLKYKVPHQLQQRFDVIGITPTNHAPEINWVSNAF